MVSVYSQNSLQMWQYRAGVFQVRVVEINLFNRPIDGTLKQYLEYALLCFYFAFKFNSNFLNQLKIINPCDVHLITHIRNLDFC